VGYEPDAATLAYAQAAGVSKISVSHDPVEAVKGADVIYTDVWASMGQKDTLEAKMRDFKGFGVSAFATQIFYHYIHKFRRVNAHVKDKTQGHLLGSLGVSRFEKMANCDSEETPFIGVKNNVLLELFDPYLAVS
jgi:hypothetical protein